jgi:hypothetical protein
LEAQLAIAQHFIGYDPEKIYTEVYTGTKLKDCKQLWAAIDYCKKTGYKLVIAKTDRFRNTMEALTVLDEMGEGNIQFCDLPTSDRTVLTIFFAIWERQATIGKINTKLALAVRKGQAERGETWISKSGRLCDHLGNVAGCDLTVAREAAAANRRARAINWRLDSPAYKRVKVLYAKGYSRNRILEELNELYDVHGALYGTPQGARVTKGTLSRWLSQINPIAI